MATYRVPVRFRYTIAGETTVDVEASSEEEARKLAVDNFDVNHITDPSDANEEIEADVVGDKKIKKLKHR